MRKQGRPPYKSANEVCNIKYMVLLSMDDLELLATVKRESQIESTSELFRTLLRRERISAPKHRLE